MASRNRYAPKTMIDAYSLYMTGNTSLLDISRQLSVPLNTVKNWMKRDEWAEKRRKHITTAVERVNHSLAERCASSYADQVTVLDKIQALLMQMLSDPKSPLDLKDIAKISSIIASNSRVVLPINTRLFDEYIAKQKSLASAGPLNPIQFQLGVQAIPDKRASLSA